MDDSDFSTPNGKGTRRDHRAGIITKNGANHPGADKRNDSRAPGWTPAAKANLISSADAQKLRRTALGIIDSEVLRLRSTRDDLNTELQSTKSQLRDALDDVESLKTAKADQDTAFELHKQQSETRDAELAATQAQLRDANAQILELKRTRLEQGRKREEQSKQPYSVRHRRVSGMHMRYLREEFERVGELGAEGMGMAEQDFQALRVSWFEEYMFLDADKAVRGWHQDF